MQIQYNSKTGELSVLMNYLVGALIFYIIYLFYYKKLLIFFGSFLYNFKFLYLLKTLLNCKINNPNYLRQKKNMKNEKKIKTESE